MPAGGGNPQINILPAAVSTMCAYPIAKLRKDMNSQEYATYRNNWILFNTVWSYNYTVSTINGLSGGGLRSYYQFSSNTELQNYRQGQIAHDTVYSNAPVGQFTSIGTG